MPRWIRYLLHSWQVSLWQGDWVRLISSHTCRFEWPRIICFPIKFIHAETFGNERACGSFHFLFTVVCFFVVLTFAFFTEGMNLFISFNLIVLCDKSWNQLLSQLNWMANSKDVSKRERFYVSNYLQQAYLVKMDVLDKEKVWPLNFYQPQCQVYLNTCRWEVNANPLSIPPTPPPKKNLHQWLGSHTIPTINLFILNDLFNPNNL